MYWSDCSGVATIQSARIEDGGDRQTLISDDQHSCIVDIVIDLDSRLHRPYINAKDCWLYLEISASPRQDQADVRRRRAEATQ